MPERWRGISGPGAGGEGFQRRHARVGVLGPVDRPQLRNDRLAIRPGHEFERMADKVNDAGLDDRTREDRLDRLRKALQAVAVKLAQTA